MITEDVIILTYPDYDYKVICKKEFVDTVNNCMSVTHNEQSHIDSPDDCLTVGFSACGYWAGYSWISKKKAQEQRSFKDLIKSIGLSIHEYKMTHEEAVGGKDHIHTIYKAITGEDLG